VKNVLTLLVAAVFVFNLAGAGLANSLAPDEIENKLEEVKEIETIEELEEAQEDLQKNINTQIKDIKEEASKTMTEVEIDVIKDKTDNIEYILKSFKEPVVLFDANIRSSKTLDTEDTDMDIYSSSFPPETYEETNIRTPSISGTTVTLKTTVNVNRYRDDNECGARLNYVDYSWETSDQLTNCSIRGWNGGGVGEVDYYIHQWCVDLVSNPYYEKDDTWQTLPFYSYGEETTVDATDEVNEHAYWVSHSGVGGGVGSYEAEWEVYFATWDGDSTFTVEYSNPKYWGDGQTFDDAPLECIQKVLR